MKFHALLPVRDEADIIKQSLQHLLQWCDAVYVLDTGSVDDTWEIILDFASQEKRIITIGKEPVYFSDTIVRGYIFDQARKYMQDGDWFLRVDADEFHHIPPPEFVKTRLQKHETVVYHQYYDFQITEAEVKKWETGEETLDDRQRPIEDRRRYFIPSYYSEPRLCRYRSTMRWAINCSFPINAGFVARERLPIRHYPHRDPLQLKRRYILRSIMMADKINQKSWAKPEEHHWAEADWKKFIIKDDEPKLQYWHPSKNLPEYHFINHLSPMPKRLLQRSVHFCLLPLLDATRPGFPKNVELQPISAEVQQLLVKNLNTKNLVK